MSRAHSDASRQMERLDSRLSTYRGEDLVWVVRELMAVIASLGDELAVLKRQVEEAGMAVSDHD